MRYYSEEEKNLFFNYDKKYYEILNIKRLRKFLKIIKKLK